MGRKKLSWLRNIRQWTGENDIHSRIHTARDREGKENVIVNIHYWIAFEEKIGNYQITLPLPKRVQSSSFKV